MTIAQASSSMSMFVRAIHQRCTTGRSGSGQRRTERPTVRVVSKRGRQGRHTKGGRVTPKGTRPAGSPGRSWSPPDDDEPDLMRSIRRALHSGEPLDLLAEVSSLLTVVDPREYGFGRRDGEPPYSLRELVDMFLDVDRVETSALLAVVAELAGDDVLAARIRRELAGRGDRLPEWLARLGEAEVYGAREMVHVLGDGDNINLAVRFAGGAELTAVVYIDHNMGTLVKDAFVVPESLAGLEVFMRTKADDPDTVWRDLDLADARVRITEAIERAAMTVPPFETDTWPACRPIVEWLTRQMPAGGVGYQRPEWSERDRQELADRFFASPFGAPLDDADHRGLLDSVIWFGADYGPGDPMRWSPVAVEIILEDWIPRKIVADAAYLSKAPDLLRAFIRFCHAERGIRAELTPRHARRGRRLRAGLPAHDPLAAAAGSEALLAAMGAVDPDGPWPIDERARRRRRHAFDFGDHGGVHARAARRGRRRRRGAPRPRRPAAARRGLRLVRRRRGHPRPGRRGARADRRLLRRTARRRVPHGVPPAARPGRGRRSRRVPPAGELGHRGGGDLLDRRQGQRPLQPLRRRDARQGSAWRTSVSSTAACRNGPRR